MYTQIDTMNDDEINTLVYNSISMADLPEPKNYAMGDPQNKYAVVLQHGFIGSPLDWVYISSHLAKNYRVVLPLLPGHGSTAKALHGIKYKQWINATEEAINYLKEERADRKIALVGHSLGGSIALIHAAQRNDISAVATLSSPVRFDFLRRTAAKLLGIPFGWFYMPYSEFLFHDSRMYKNTYIKYLNANFNKISMSTIRQVMLLIDHAYKSLPSIKIPYLNIHSIYDKTVPYNNVEYIMQKITSHDKQHIKLEQSYHIILADTDKVLVRNKLIEFLQQYLHI